MLSLVTIDDAVDQIRGDRIADASWLATWIPIVSAAVAGWLKDSWRLYVPELGIDGKPIEDSNGDPIPSEDSNGFVLQPAVRGAVLMELANAYQNREGGGNNDMPEGGRSINGQGYGYTLTRASTAMLASLRKSTVA